MTHIVAEAVEAIGLRHVDDYAAELKARFEDSLEPQRPKIVTFRQRVDAKRLTPPKA